MSASNKKRTAASDSGADKFRNEYMDKFKAMRSPGKSSPSVKGATSPVLPVTRNPHLTIQKVMAHNGVWITTILGKNNIDDPDTFAMLKEIQPKLFFRTVQSTSKDGRYINHPVGRTDTRATMPLPFAPRNKWVNVLGVHAEDEGDLEAFITEVKTAVAEAKAMSKDLDLNILPDLNLSEADTALWENLDYSDILNNTQQNRGS